MVKSNNEKPADFKLTTEEDPEVKKTKSGSKKTTSDPSVILDEIFKNETSFVNERKFEIPKALPTVDFMDEPSNRQNKSRKNERQSQGIDYAKEPVRKFEKPAPRKRQKFSKVSNPFPNDPAKNPAKADSEMKVQQQKSPSKEKKPSTDASGSSNSSVFTTDLVDSLKIHPFSIKNMKEVLLFSKLTHVQQKSIPAALEGKDLLIRSPTGKYPNYDSNEAL